MTTLALEGPNASYETRFSAALALEKFAPGYVIDATYRVQSMLSENERAHVYVVSHVRFPEVPLVLKVAALERQAEFELNTAALASVTSPCVTRVVDRGKLPDGRPFRVVERLAGPTLRQALMTGSFSEDRAMEILVALAAATHEAQVNGLGPCDLSVDNLMFADGRNGKLCMMRVLVEDAQGPDLAADQESLARLRDTLERGQSSRGITTNPWKPPSNLEELRKAMVQTGAPRTPETSNPGAHIHRWEVVKKISESLHATVYEVKGITTTNPGSPIQGILKVAGPESDFSFFKRHADLLSRVNSRHVVKVLDMGTHEGTPFMVMEPLHLAQNLRLQYGGMISIDAALQTIDELLWGAEAINQLAGSPSDFSLEHCYQKGRESSPAVLTHAMIQLRTFGLYGRPPEAEYADAWSATVALYELIAGRLPFPTTKHSLAKAWMGMPMPIGAKRRDVPIEVSELVHAILTGKKMKTAELRREITRIRSTPHAMRASVPPSDPSAPALLALAASHPPKVKPKPHPIDALRDPSPAPTTVDPPPPPAPEQQTPVMPQQTPVIAVLPAPHISTAPPPDKKFVTDPTALIERLTPPSPGATQFPQTPAPPAVRSSAPPEERQIVPPEFRKRLKTPAPAVVERRSIEPPDPLEALNDVLPIIGGLPPAQKDREKEARLPQGSAAAEDAPDWRLEIAEGRCPLPAIIAAAFGRDGREIVAVGDEAVARYRRGQWTIDPAREVGAKVKSITAMSDGGYLATTITGPLYRLPPSGGFVPWGVNLGRFYFQAAIPDGDNFILVGGTMIDGKGVVTKLVGESMTIVADNLDLRPIRTATYLIDGTLLVATDGGMIARLRGSNILESIHPCEVDLLAARVVGDDILVVGTGAWAFKVTTSPLIGHLESVETLSSLTCIASDGTHAWAGSSKGRILRRRDHHWRRMNRGIEGDPSIVAIHASATRVRAITADGQIILGQPLGSKPEDDAG